MGDRYELVRHCVYCRAIEDAAWYAPSSDCFTFICKKCHKENFITTDLEVKKFEDVTYDDVYWGINNASTMMDQKQIDRCARDSWKQIQKKISRMNIKND